MTPGTKEGHSNETFSGLEENCYTLEKKRKGSNNTSCPGDSQQSSGRLRGEANFWRSIALVVAFLSTIASFAIGITETGVAKMEDSSAALGLAVTAILDALTSIVVCWRFYNASEVFSQRKEHIGSIIFGVLILCLSVASLIKCILSLVDGDTVDMSPSSERILLITSIVTAVVCFIIAAVNFLLAKKLSSWVIFSDALDSLVGGVIAISMIIESVVTQSDPKYWYLDDIVGIVTTLLLLAYGIWLLVKHTRELQRMNGYEETD